MVKQNFLLALAIIAAVFSMNCDARTTRNQELERGNGRINNAISWMKKQVRKLKKNMSECNYLFMVTSSILQLIAHQLTII